MKKDELNSMKKYQLNDDSVRKIVCDLLEYDHIVIDYKNDEFDLIFKKYYWQALDEFYCRQKLLEVIYKN